MKKCFYVFIALFIFILTAFAQKDQTNQPALSFGVITDCHFIDAPRKGRRHYRLADKKLKEAIGQFNSQSLDFVVNLGDLINDDFDSLAMSLSIIKLSKAPVYSALGNHDLYVEDGKKEKVAAKLRLKKRYYDFKVKGWRLVVLDGNEMSLYAYSKGTKKYRDTADFFKKYGIKLFSWETDSFGIGPAQLLWLENRLKEASLLKEKVIIFCHFTAYPDVGHNLANADKLISLIKRYPCVKAYISGHYHPGNYAFKDNIHYLTLKAMVDTKNNAYSIIRVFADRLDLKGFGREPDQVMLLK